MVILVFCCGSFRKWCRQPSVMNSVGIPIPLHPTHRLFGNLIYSRNSGNQIELALVCCRSVKSSIRLSEGWCPPVTQTHSQFIPRWVRSWLVSAPLIIVVCCAVISISADTTNWSPKPCYGLRGVFSINITFFTHTSSTDLNSAWAFKRYLSGFTNAARGPRWAIFQHP